LQVHEPFHSNFVVFFASSDLPQTSVQYVEAGFSEEARTEVAMKVTFDRPTLLDPLPRQVESHNE